jgi:hypothetical protein
MATGLRLNKKQMMFLLFILLSLLVTTVIILHATTPSAFHALAYTPRVIGHHH